MGTLPPPRLTGHLSPEEKVRVIAAIDHDARGPQGVLLGALLRVQMMGAELERAARPLLTGDGEDAGAESAESAIAPGGALQATVDRTTLANIVASMRKELASITAVSRFLMDLQHDIVDALRLDFEAPQTQVRKMRAFDVLRHAYENNVGLASNANIVLRAGSSRLEFVNDERLVDRILNNLIANAVRHSGGKHILVGARLRGGDIVFEVRDDGRGLKPEALTRIFEPMPSEPRLPGVGRSAAGAGLGLYIVRRFAEYMGGTVSCRSAPGAGTTFEVKLPGPATILPERPHRIDPEISAAVKDKFVAILDDDAELLKSTERLFETRGVHVLCAQDPVPWLNGLAEVQRMPDLFLMDYQLKGQDVELTLDMVKRKWSDKNPRIIVLTGHLSNPALQRISKSTPVLRKPLSDARFNQVLEILAGHARMPEAGFL